MSEGECIAHVLSECKAGRGGWIVTVNLDHLRRLVRDQSYSSLCQRATLLTADGRPLLWAARLAGTPLPGQVAGSNLIHTLTAAAAKVGRSVFFLGGEPGTADAAARILAERNPGLRVAGTYCPPMGFEKDPQQVEMIRRMLIDARPDIVYVGLGSPKQEELIDQFRRQGDLPSPGAGAGPGVWWMGVGISFSYVCGDVKRAPRWMQVIGLEWAHRLVQEPRRLFKRYIVQGIPFAIVLFASALAQRLGFWRRDRHNPRATLIRSKTDDVDAGERGRTRS